LEEPLGFPNLDIAALQNLVFEGEQRKEGLGAKIVSFWLRLAIHYAGYVGERKGECGPVPADRRRL
jgi:hypothetical protein